MNAGVGAWRWLNNADSSDQLLQSMTEDLYKGMGHFSGQPFPGICLVF